MACDTASVASWAGPMAVPTCVGTAFCAQYGRLPNSINELDTWGDATGYRVGGSSWTCTPSANPGSGQPNDKATTPVIVAKGSGSIGFSGITAFVKANPVLTAAGVGLAAVALLKK